MNMLHPAHLMSFSLSLCLFCQSANLSLSTCSTSEVEGEKAGSSMDISQKKEAAEDSTEEKKKEGEEGAEGEGSKEPSSSLGEAGFITVHLKMPGVPQPVDVMV